MFRKSTESTLAIDLAVEAVRVLDVRLRRSTPHVTAFASQSVAAGTPETLPERQLSALAGLLATHRLRTHRCVAALPTSLVFTRAMPMDPSKNMSDQEQIGKILQNCLPFDPSDAIFDFWPTNDGDNSARREVLVVATQASVVERYLAGFEKLKLTCSHLDVAPCAVAALIARDSANAGSLVGTVTLGDSSGYFAVIEKGKVLFWRPFDLPNGAGQRIASAGASLDRVGDEISKCVSHMVGSMHVDTMSELLVFGHGADEASFADYLKNRFHVPVRSLSPFDSLPPESMPSDVRSAVRPAVATHFAAAVGLAMQPTGVTANG